MGSVRLIIANVGLEHDIVGDILLECDQNSLKELGIKKVGDRIRIHQSLKRLRARDAANSAAPTPTVLSMDVVKQATVRFIYEQGHSKTVYISGCFNGDSIKRKALKKIGIKDMPENWDVYIADNELGTTKRMVSDNELVTICHSQDRKERNRLMLCAHNSGGPTIKQLSKSQQILRESLNSPSTTHFPEDASTLTKKPLRKFYGQRPPSELISSNLKEYFPEAGPAQLKETIRNSIMYKRMSRMSRMSRISQRSSIVSASGPWGYQDEVVPPMPSMDDFMPGTSTSTSTSTSTVTTTIPSNSSATLETTSEEIEPETRDEEEFMDAFNKERSGPSRWIKGTVIGSGSFGVVYLGMNSITGELMAVKQVEMPKGNSDNEQKKMNMIDALQREMNFLRELQHENIVQYLGSNSEESFLNIFLEYVPGGSVATMLSNYGAFEESLIRNFVRQILHGLKYLHDRSIIHRDIKGANVLVDNKGGIKISDFGISKKIETRLQNNRVSLQGSVYWMAPEVVKQTSYTLKADIWSLGCLVIEMFTGTHPFPEFSQMQAIFKIGTFVSPSIPTDCSDDAKEFLKKTFEIDFNKRPTAEELLKETFLKPLL